MPALVCGSLAFDTITTFPGRFADQIHPERVHMLNVSFLVPTLRREFGGCAGNIAYNLQALGGQAVVLAAVGLDGRAYLQRLAGLGIDVGHVGVIEDSYTAQATIITDTDNNQITAFHPGAMAQAHTIELPSRDDLAIAIVGPDGRHAMLQRARSLHARALPFVFDPGQGLPMFDGAELDDFVARASWVAVNDYEAAMLGERLGCTMQTLSQRPNLRGVVVTLGARGCEVWQDGVRTPLPGEPVAHAVDPTGCGDAFRAALLYGLERQWPLERAAALGNRLGALKVASPGPQNHRVDAEALGA